MGPHSGTVLYYLSLPNLLRMHALFNRTHSNEAVEDTHSQPRSYKPGFGAYAGTVYAASITNPTPWTVAVFRHGGAALAQENCRPRSRQKIVAGVQALKSGDLDSAEKVFSDVLRQESKHPLVFITWCHCSVARRAP